MKIKSKTVAVNVVMLYMMNFCQLLLPLITLPYLARVLSVDYYGVTSYIKSVMIYMTQIIEFGFLLSGTREIVKANSDIHKISKIVGKITEAKLILSLLSFCVLIVMTLTIPILRRHYLFSLLSFLPAFLDIFLFDYLFRGIEQMQIITLRFLLMKGTSCILTFIFIKSDKDLLLIPILDIIGSLVAIMWVYFEVRKLNIKICFVSLIKVIASLKESFIYYISNVASTAFGALNTLIVGIFLSSKDVAFWGVIMTIVSGIQSLYSPISDGIYPHMIKTKSLKLFYRTLGIFVPLLIIGCLSVYLLSPLILNLFGGVKYLVAAKYLRECVPLLFISFFTALFGWPVLGAIGKIKETTATTVIAGIVQVLGLGFLIVSKIFSIESLIVLRIISEFVMATLRICCFVKYRDGFMAKK